MGRGLVLGLVLSSGCGQLFGLVEVDDVPRDARTDAFDANAADDAHDATDAATDAFVASIVCPPAYSITLTGSDSRYREITIADQWVDQHNDCANDSAGLTHLVVLDMLAESTALHALLDLRPPPAYWWTGAIQDPAATDRAGGWIWVTGESIAASSWNGGEPNDGDNVENHQEDEALLETNRTGVVDIFGLAMFSAMCECDGKGVHPIVDTYLQ